MPMLSEEEQKKGQERGQQYVSVTGQQVANLNQVQKQQYQSQTARQRQEVSKSYEPFRPNDSANWDYKNATRGVNGEELPKGAQGWDARGRPYFGSGIQGTLKRWGYEWTKDVDVPTAAKWDEIAAENAAMTEEFNKTKAQYESGEIGTGDYLKFAGQQALQGIGLAAQQVSAAWQTGEADGSLLSVPLKATRVGFTVLSDTLQEAGIKVEQTLGAQRAALESVGQYKRIDYENDVATFAANLISIPLQTYKMYHFWTAPTTFEQKKEVLEKGWTEGRLLYTSFVEPAVRQEYLSRAMAGEDPYLLSLELENPIAEAAGQLIADPLNVIGLFAKGAKVANSIDDASDLVKGSGLTQDATKIFGNIADLPEARQLGKLDEFADTVKGFFYEGDELKTIIPQSYKPGALNASGNVTRQTKKMGNIFTWMSANLMTEGRPVDDIQEYMAALINISSKNLDEVKDGITTLSHFPSPATHFGQDFLETSSTLRNIIGDEKDVSKFVQKFAAAKGDWTKVGQIGMGIMNDAAKAQFPSISQLKAAGEAVESGGKVTAKTERMAKEYAALKNSNPGLIRLAEIDELASKPKNAINGMLGNFYFSYQYGVAMRNKIQNDLITLIDAGPGAWFEKGRYLSENAITEKILATHGGQLPPAATGFQSLRKSIKAGSDKFLGVIPSGSALMEKYEVSAAKRVYWKYYRQTVDAITEPGRALPSLDEFAKVGFSEKQVKKFTRLVKDNYGDVNKALSEFDELFKGGQVDEWRLFEDYLPENVLKGLDEQEIMDEISVLSRTKDITRDEIATKIDDLIAEASKRAEGIKYDGAGQSLDNPGITGSSDWASVAKPSIDSSNRMDVLQESARQAENAYKDALFQAVRIEDRAGNPAPLEEYNRIFVKASPKETKINEDVRGVLSSSREAIVNVRKKGADPIREWSKLPFGDPPADLTKETFGDAIYSMSGYDGYTAKRWEQHAQDSINISEGLARKYGINGIFENAKKVRADFEVYRTAEYRGGGIFDVSDAISTGKVGTAQHGNNVATVANKYGISSVGESGAKQDKKLLNFINDFVGAKTDETATLTDAVKLPRSELPPVAEERIGQQARSMLSDFRAGEGPVSSVPGQIDASEGAQVINTPSTNVQWYRELPANMKKRSVVDSALTKIIEDAGKDKGVNVERFKDLILDIFTYGDETTGTPPDLAVLKSLDAPKDVMNTALNSFNEITRQNLSLDDALKASGYVPSGFQKLDDVPLDIAEKAFANQQRRMIETKLFDPNTPKEELDALRRKAAALDNQLQPVPEEVMRRIPPPYPDGATPSMARAAAEGVEGTIEALQTAKTEILKRFGVKVAADYSPEMRTSLKSFAKLSSDKMAEGRLIAQKAGQYWRDFALLPYGETTHLDHAMSYIFPYQFWYSRSYATWAKRLATNPEIVAAYAKIKDKMAALHKDAPEWWRYNVTLPEWMWGLNNNNPMYINLEAAVWPLYGITGTDFNEPRKRIDWLTSTVDDMGKFGPSVWAPIQIAMAAMLKAKGEDEAASYWGSRLIPQTATVKSIMSLLGKTPIELDPAVQQFSGEGIFDWSAQDPYEQRRTGRMLGSMAMEGIPEEQLAEAGYAHSGPLWDEAYRRATELRAPGQLGSFFLGVGFKARTPEDVEIDKFYGDMGRLMQMREADLISPSDYTKAWDSMRETYPFMDVMLLSRKAGDLRDEAYAWNVINRIPPGQTKEIYQRIGIDPETASSFYENRGDMSGWSASERERFMNAIVELGATLAIPQNADRNEWSMARESYKNMGSVVEDTFGNDIQDRISLYFGLQDREEAKRYMDANPDVEAALNLQNQLILQNPVLDKYYGGLDTFDRYYTSQMYDELEKRYGNDITKVAAAYSEAKYRLLDDDLAKQILKENPKLKKYWDDKSAMNDVLTRAMIDFGTKLPEQPYPEFRTDLGDLTPQQQAVINQTPQRSFQEFVQITGEPIAELVVMYLQGEDLPKEVTDELDYLAPKYGYYDGQDMLVQMSISYQQGVQ